MNAYWRVANYLSVGQIYLYGNPLLKRPLEFSDVSGLAVGQQLAGRQRPQRAAPKPGRPQSGRAVIGQPGRSGHDGIRGRIGAGGGLGATSPGEREQQRGPEDGDHDGN